MSYRIRLPSGSDAGTLDIVDPSSTTIQRVLRHRGLAGYEPPTMSTLLALFELQADGFTFFDIGANMGLYAATCASLFAPGAVHAFEPAPGTASVARKIARANRLRIQVFEVALSDGDGVAQLHLSEKSDSSHSLVAGFKRSSGSVDVRTCRLDRHVDRAGVVPDVMKIDVETFEPQVIAGGTETIARHRPIIVIEVLHRRGHDHGEEITEVMQPFGYSYYRLGESPDWRARDRISGSPNGECDDWLLTPDPVDPALTRGFDRYRQRLRSCEARFNSRVPSRTGSWRP